MGVPWVRPGSGFTLLFDALALQLVAHIPVAAVARQVGEHDTRIGRLLRICIQEALSERDLSEVARMVMDETSCRRGQDYISLFAA